MADLTKLSDGVLDDIRGNLGPHMDVAEKDKLIAKMDEREMFRRWCVWNGLLDNYYVFILDAQAEIKKACRKPRP